MKVSTADQFYSAMAHLSVQLLDEKIIDADNLIRVRPNVSIDVVTRGSFLPLGYLQFWSISDAHAVGITAEILVQYHTIPTVIGSSDESVRVGSFEACGYPKQQR